MKRHSNVSKALKGIPKNTYSIYIRKRGDKWGSGKLGFWARDVKAYNKDQAKAEFYAKRGFKKLDKGYVIARIVRK